jgi:hypothetical protein
MPSDRNWLIGSSTFGGVPLDYDLIVEGYRSAEFGRGLRPPLF